MRANRSLADRLTWVVVAAVAALTVTAIAVLILNRTDKTHPDLSTPEGVVTAFIRAVQAGNADEAWSYISPQATMASGPPFKGPFTTKEQFRSEMRSGSSAPSSRIRIVNVRNTGTSAVVDVELTSAPGGLFGSAYSHTESISLDRSQGSWLITSFVYPGEFQ